MELLDLSPELLARVIHLLVEVVGVCDAFEYRLVCSKCDMMIVFEVKLNLVETFATEIFHNVVVFQPLEAFKVADHSSKQRALDRLFLSHGVAFLHRRIVSPHGFCSTLLDLIKRAVDNLLLLDGSESDSMRNKYTKSVCNAVTQAQYGARSIRLYDFLVNAEYKPYEPELPNVAAATAAGHVSAVRHYIQKESDTLNHYHALVTALSAAASNGELEIMQVILNHEHYLDLGEEVVQEFKKAMHKSEFIVVEALEDYMEKRKRSFVFPARIDSGFNVILRACVANNSTRLVYRLLKAQYGEIHVGRSTIGPLCQVGDGTVLRNFLERGLIRPKTFQYGMSPLLKALLHGRYDLAEMILEYGTNINALSLSNDGTNVTVLWHATKNGTKRMINFLLKNGADPDCPHGSGLTAIDAAKAGGSDAIQNLLLGAKKK